MSVSVSVLWLRLLLRSKQRTETKNRNKEPKQRIETKNRNKEQVESQKLRSSSTRVQMAATSFLCAVASTACCIFWCTERRKMARNRDSESMALVQNRDHDCDRKSAPFDLQCVPLLSDQPLVGEISCPICLQNYQGEEIVLLPCLHSFHRECLSEWTRRREDCPMCRVELTRM